MAKNKFILIASILLSLVCVIIAVYLYDYSIRLDEQIKSRDELIDELRLKQDSVRVDTVTTTISSTLTLNGEKITTSELIRYANGLHKELNLLQDSLQYYKTFYNLSKKNNKSDFDVKIEGNKIKYVYSSRTLDIDTVQALLDKKASIANDYIGKFNELADEHNKLKNDIDMYKKAISKYGIQFKDIEKKGNTISYYIIAPQVDSALMLLPYYRKQLKYDDRKGQWSIGIKKWF